jgi:PKD repeat protein
LDGPYGNPVDVKIAPDGMLYYVDIGTIGLPGTGSVRRIRYDLSNQPPVITTATADPLSGPMAPLTVNFSGAATDPENDPLNYLWEFGDGITSTLPSPTHLYTGRGYYTARLTVSDSENQTLSAPIRLTVGMPPQVTVTAPTNNHIFVAGEVITFTGTATDPDGVLTPANYTWRVIFHHNEHLHPAEGPITGATSGSFTIPITGHDFSGNTRFEILLTVTDADGIPTTQSVWVYPRKVNVTLATTPPGLGVTIDQSSGLVSPITRDTLAGFQHSVTVPPIQTLNGQTVYFGGWTDGITTSTRLVTIPLTNTTVTANFFYRTFLPVMRR